MREIRHDILTDPSKFDLIMLPVSCYQKKDGTIPAIKDGFLEKLSEKHPNILADIGKSVETYGNCPSMIKTVADSKLPTKFATFPTVPSGLRAEHPDDYVFSRLKGKFKNYSLLPGWAIMPRIDMVEFSSIKLAEIIKYYKLTKVAIPFEMFTFDREDKSWYDKIRNMMEKYLGAEVYMVSKPTEAAEGTVYSNTVSSSVSFEEE